MRARRSIALALTALISTSAVLGQQVSQRREVAVFALSYAKWGIPAGGLALVDEQIQQVFAEFGRFDIIGMEYRLELDTIESFIDRIRKAKAQNLEIPETVRLDQAAFTEEDFNRLVGSFIVVIPTLSYYDSRQTDGGSVQAELETTFTFINVEETRTIGRFDITTQASASSLPAAIREAAGNIAPQLRFELRAVPEFQLRTGIIDINRGNVLLEFGRAMGVRRGDEYVITEIRSPESGSEVADEIGLLIVKDVEEEISFARVIYSSRKPQVGDQLIEITRLGFDTGAYAHLIVGLSPGSGLTGAIGIRQSTSRGFYSLRPFVGLEIPFGITSALGLSGLTANIYGGGEINWFLRRVQLTPAVAIGLSGTVPLREEESLAVSHLGGFVELTTSYLVNRDLTIGIDLGYAGWFGLGDASTYTGGIVGAGATYKY